MINTESVNSQIISAVVKWGAITHEDLYSYLNLSSQFDTLRRKTNYLIQKKVLKSIKIPTQKRAIVCAAEGTRKLLGDDINLTHVNQLSHDSALSSICIKILNLRNVFDISIVRQEDVATKDTVIPDAEALVSVGDNSINIAIEYELTQKSKHRIFQKFLSYSQSNDHRYVFYFFDTEREAVVYVNNLHVLEGTRLSQNTNFKKSKFYFFVRNKSSERKDFLSSFKPIYPSDVTSLIKILNPSEVI